MEGVAAVDSAGLEDQFRSMYEAALPTVYGFLSFRTTGDLSLAEDLTSETFAAAVSRFKDGQQDTVTTSWLLTVARRRLIDHWRRAEVADRKLVLLQDRVTASEPTVGERELVMEILASLPEIQRTALVLQHLDGLAVQEIAEIIGRSITATESLLARARRSFRNLYEEADHG